MNFDGHSMIRCIAGLSLVFSILAATPSFAVDYPINETPMYGGVAKSPELEATDEEFIEYILSKGVTRATGSDRMVSLGWQYFARRNLAVAMKRFNQAWLLDPENGDIYHGFAVLVLERDGNSGDGERYFRMALEKPRHSPGVLLDFGRFLLIEKRPREALPVLQKAAEIPNMNTEVFAMLAEAHYLTGAYKEACAAAKKVGDDAQPDLQKNAQWVIDEIKCRLKYP